jgi:hypothetical protein
MHGCTPWSRRATLISKDDQDRVHVTRLGERLAKMDVRRQQWQQQQEKHSSAADRLLMLDLPSHAGQQ